MRSAAVERDALDGAVRGKQRPGVPEIARKTLRAMARYENGAAATEFLARARAAAQNRAASGNNRVSPSENIRMNPISALVFVLFLGGAAFAFVTRMPVPVPVRWT